MNKIDDFKKFALHQKYIRRFIQNQWPELAHEVSSEHPIEAIDLEKTHESYLHDGETVEYIVQSEHEEWRGPLLKDSLYVEFLGHFKNMHADDVSDEAIRSTLYYQDAKECLKTIGHFRGNTTESDIMAQARYFLNLFRATRDKTFFTNYAKFADAGINHSQDPYAKVIKVSHPGYYLICDGHHRLACHYAMGKRFVKAKIVGVKV